MKLKTKTKIITFVASERRSEMIQSVIESNDKFMLQNEFITDGTVPIKNVLKSLSTQTLDIVVIDLMAIENKNIIEALQSYRGQKAETRIVLMLESIHKVGDKQLKHIVSLGIYDLITYREDIEAEQEELEELLLNPAPYTRVMKYQNFTEDSLMDGSDSSDGGVQKIIHTPVFNSRIMVASLYDGAGSSFLAMNLAKMFSDSEISVSLVEPPVGRAYIYHTLDFDRRIDKRKEYKRDDEDKPVQALFKSFPHDILVAGNSGTMNYQLPDYNKDDYIQFFITSPYGDKAILNNWTNANSISLLNVASNTTVTILDVGSNLLNKNYSEILTHMKKIYVVIEPMIGNIMEYEQELKDIVKLQKQGLPIEFIFNKVASTNELKINQNFREIKAIANATLTIPYLSPSAVQKAHNTGQYAIEESGICEELYKSLRKVAEQFVQKDLIYKFKTAENEYLTKAMNILSVVWGLLKTIYTGIKDARKRNRRNY